MRRIGSTFGLLLNEHKCELVTNDLEVVKKFAPTIIHVDISQADLLGAPIGGLEEIDVVPTKKISDFQRLHDLQTETAMCTRRILSVEELFQSAQVAIHHALRAVLQ